MLANTQNIQGFLLLSLKTLAVPIKMNKTIIVNALKKANISLNPPLLLTANQIYKNLSRKLLETPKLRPKTLYVIK